MHVQHDAYSYRLWKKDPKMYQLLQWAIFVFPKRAAGGTQKLRMNRCEAAPPRVRSAEPKKSATMALGIRLHERCREPCSTLYHHTAVCTYSVTEMHCFGRPVKARLVYNACFVFACTIHIPNKSHSLQSPIPTSAGSCAFCYSAFLCKN